MRQLLNFLVTVFSLAAFAHIFATAEQLLTLTILHTNDVHSRFLETNQVSGGCSAEEKEQKKCYGGFSRIHYKVTNIKIRLVIEHFDIPFLPTLRNN